MLIRQHVSATAAAAATRKQESWCYFLSKYINKFCLEQEKKERSKKIYEVEKRSKKMKKQPVRLLESINQSWIITFLLRFFCSMALFLVMS